MTDRELLERAAKAAGIKVWAGKGHQDQMLFTEPAATNGIVTGVEWNPLTDDGDNARLRRAKRIVVQWFPTDVAAMHWGDGRGRICAEPYGEDPAAAERRAVVRAAAAMTEEAR